MAGGRNDTSLNNLGTGIVPVLKLFAGGKNRVIILSAMGALIIPLLLFFQDAGQNPALQSEAESHRREAALRSVAEVLGHESENTPEAVRKNGASVQERLFVEKFNKLLYTLTEFADDYKIRQTIDVKKAKAVREAWHKLEKAEALFQDDKKK